MARLVWAVLSRRSIIDKHTSLVSVFDVIEALNVVDPKPYDERGTLEIELSLTLLWTREASEKPEPDGTARVRVIGPRGRKGPVTELAVSMERFKRTRNIFRISQLPWDGLGEYRFAVEYVGAGKKRGAVRASVPLEVLAEPAPRAKPEG